MGTGAFNFRGRASGRSWKKKANTTETGITSGLMSHLATMQTSTIIIIQFLS